MKKLTFFQVVTALIVIASCKLFSIAPAVYVWDEDHGMLGTWKIMAIHSDTDNDGCYDHVVIFVDGVYHKEWDLLRFNNTTLPLIEQSHLYNPAHVWSVDSMSACGIPIGIRSFTVKDMSNNLVGTLTAACPDSIIYATVIIPPPLATNIEWENTLSSNEKIYNVSEMASTRQLGFDGSGQVRAYDLMGKLIYLYNNLGGDVTIDLKQIGNGTFFLIDEQQKSVLLINDLR